MLFFTDLYKINTPKNESTHQKTGKHTKKRENTPKNASPHQKKKFKAKRSNFFFVWFLCFYHTEKGNNTPKNDLPHQNCFYSKKIEKNLKNSKIFSVMSSTVVVYISVFLFLLPNLF